MNTPRTLADLIQQVKREDGVTLQAIANRGGLKLATVGAWSTGTRGVRQPPAPRQLDKLARGLRRPIADVYDAAGRVHPSRLRSDEAEAQHITRLYLDLDERDRAVVRALLLAMRRHTR